MKWIISLLTCFGCTGCLTTQHSAIQPTDLSGIKSSVIAASEGVTKSATIAADVLKTGAKPGDLRVKALALQLQTIQKDLAQARKDIDDKQAQINEQTIKINKLVDRLNQLEIENPLLRAAKRKWMMYAIGTWIAVGCLFVFRGWLKAHLPFLAPFI